MAQTLSKVRSLVGLRRIFEGVLCRFCERLAGIHGLQGDELRLLRTLRREHPHAKADEIVALCDVALRWEFPVWGSPFPQPELFRISHPQPARIWFC